MCNDAADGLRMGRDAGLAAAREVRAAWTWDTAAGKILRRRDAIAGVRG
jgi:hypothetical protein